MSPPSPGKSERHERCAPCCRAKARVGKLLRREGKPVKWEAVARLLRKLPVAAGGPAACCDDIDDPHGRLLLVGLLRRDPPTDILECALRAFPSSLHHSPAAFFAACGFCSPRTVALLMRRLVRHSEPSRNDVAPEGTAAPECPYPWILSDMISTEGARAMLRVYPQGVLQESPSLLSLGPLDFFLVSPDMARKRDFGPALWIKFKLMLVAAECCLVGQQTRRTDSMGLSPVHVILARVLKRQGVLDDPEVAKHILWLLGQLRYQDDWVFEKQSAGGVYPLHFALGHKCTKDRNGLVACRELIKLLLSAYPSAAKLPLEGRLPIHLAVENGWPCHDLLLSLYPESLDIRDPATGFVPFQAAATSSVVPGFSLDVTFELLRANPAHAERRFDAGSAVGAKA